MSGANNILAAGPWVQPPGKLRHRVVLRVCDTQDGSPDKFVVGTECVFEDGRHAGFTDGHYFPARSFGKGRTAVVSAFEAAFRRWQEKTAEKTLGLDYDTLFKEEKNV